MNNRQQLIFGIDLKINYNVRHTFLTDPPFLGATNDAEIFFLKQIINEEYRKTGHSCCCYLAQYRFIMMYFAVEK